jgi:protein-S-isoprenylcysteine O-methyltransferase Ste14
LKSNILTLAVVAILLPIIVMEYGHQQWTPLRIAGVALALPSFVLLIVARIQLGRSFSLQAKATALVTSGLYSRIRNPIYVFGGLTVAGAFLYFDQPWLVLLFVILVPLQVIRAKNEEAALTAKFGDAYRQYKAHTWF